MALAKGLQPERHSLSLRVRSFPFVSSEVETPIGTARSRRASRLRSMRTDMGFFMRIGIVAPSTPILPDAAEAVRAGCTPRSEARLVGNAGVWTGNTRGARD